MRPNSAKTAGNGQKTNKKGKNYAEIEFERLFFELKSDSATNQALIRPSLGFFAIIFTEIRVGDVKSAMAKLLCNDLTRVPIEFAF